MSGCVLQWDNIFDDLVKEIAKDGAITPKEYELLDAIHQALDRSDYFDLYTIKRDITLEQKKRRVMEAVTMLVLQDEKISAEEEKIVLTLIEKIFEVLQREKE